MCASNGVSPENACSRAAVADDLASHNKPVAIRRAPANALFDFKAQLGTSIVTASPARTARSRRPHGRADIRNKPKLPL